jgi:uncharacterized protein YndB with AHSA1/START domain
MIDTTAATRTTVQVHRIFIKASPQAVWDAIVDPDWNRRYGYQCASEYDLRPGGSFRTLASAAMKEFGSPDVIIDGEVVEVDPPRRLVQTWHAMFGPEMSAEKPTRLTYEIDELAAGAGICRLTVTHELENAPIAAQTVSGELPEAGGGWALILSDLKTLLETGSAFQS